MIEVLAAIGFFFMFAFYILSFLTIISGWFYEFFIKPNDDDKFRDARNKRKKN